MIKFYNEKGEACFGQATVTRSTGVNGSALISGTIFDGQEVLTKIDRGWWFKFEDDKYVVTYKKLNDNDKTIEFDAVQSFFWDFQKTVFHEQWNGSHEFTAYLEALFKNSGYKYTLDGKVSAFEKENWGYKNKLDLFNDIIQQAEMEFEVYNETIHITKQIGDDLTSIARKGINLSDLVEEMKISDFVTYGKGYGAFKDKDDQSKGRLEVEYRSELAKTYGDLEMDPIVDERYTDATSLTNAIKKQVDASYYISVSMNIYDLENAGYPNYQSPQVGDWLLAIDEALNFKRQIRIIKLEEVFDATGKRIGYTTTCGDLSTADQYQNAQGNVNNRIDDITNQIDDIATSANGKNSNYYGDTEPTNPNDGDLWYDTSSSDSDDWIIYQWHNGRWEQITLNPNQITNEINEANTDMQNAIDEAKKAAEDAEGKVDDFGDSLTIIQGDITQAKSDAANALNNVTVIDSKLTQLSDTTTARLDTLDNGYQQVLTDTSGMKTQITDIAGELNSKVSNDVYQSDKTQTANLISQTVSSAVDGLKIGGTNLVPNSGMMQSTEGWNTTGTLITTKHVFYHNGQDPIFRLSNAKGSATIEVLAFNTVRFNVKRNTNYTMSVITFATSNTVSIDLFFLGRAYGSTNDFDKAVQAVAGRKVSSNGAEYVTATFNTGDSDEGYFRIDNNGTTDGKQSDVYFTEVKVEEGTKATPWSPATIDLATATEFDQISDALKLTAKQADMTKALNSITTLTETANGLQTQVNSKAGQSQVTQLANQYQAVVGSLTGSSLIQNSGYPIDTKHWTVGGGAKSVFEVITHAFYHNSKTNVFNLINEDTEKNVECYVSSERFSVKSNTTYSLSIIAFAGSNMSGMDIFFLGRKYDSTSSTGYDKAIKIVDNKKLNASAAEYVTATFNTGECEEGYLRIDNNGTTNGQQAYLLFTEIQVNVGTIAMPWSAPTLSQTDITASIDNIHLGVKNADGTTATFNMNGNTILLDAAKVMIDGSVSIKDATISSAKIASLSADKITAGTLNASKVNVVNLNAANIVTGTIKGANLSINLNTGEVIFQHGHIYNTTGSFDMNIDEGTLKIFNSAKDSGIQMGKGKVLFTESTVWNESNPGYGQIEFGGVENLLKQGMSIVGNHVLTLRTADASDNWVSDSSEGAAIELFNADYNSSQNGVSVGIRGEQAIKITSGDLGLSTPHIIVNENKTNAIGMLGSSIDLESSLGLMESGGDFHLSNDGKARVWSSAINLRTYSNSSNVYVTEYGTLGRSTSASKYKLNITKLTDADQAHALLSINAKTWYDKKDMNNIADEMSTGLEQSADHPKIKPYLGFIAEDFANAGLETLVNRNKNGELESINYDRISALEHLNVQELFSRVLQLEKEVHELRSEAK
jgi:hypothetical protein